MHFLTQYKLSFKALSIYFNVSISVEYEELTICVLVHSVFEWPLSITLYKSLWTTKHRSFLKTKVN